MGCTSNDPILISLKVKMCSSVKMRQSIARIHSVWIKGISEELTVNIIYYVIFENSLDKSIF